MKNRFALAAILPLLLTTPLFAEDTKLRNLPKTDKPRFEITDRTWPTKPNDLQVCLWKDDKLAAVSFTIDDNMAQDHAWWLEMGKKYTYRFTWFVITDRVQGKRDPFGSWADFEKLQKAGHDIQSHTVDHLADPQLPIEDIYAKSIPAIESKLPGTKVLVLAYPGGTGSERNDPAVAAKHFIGARGGVGHLNAVNTINYMSTNSLSGSFPLDPKHWASITHLTDKTNKKLFRGFASLHFHGVKDDFKEKVVGYLDYIKQHDADLWMAPFSEVIRYGQQRDTAKLTVDRADASEVRFALTDRMDDAYFDFPLTIKHRLNPTWKSAKATQNGKDIPTSIITHDNDRYLLIDAIPDRGPVTVTPAEAPK